MSDHLFEIEVQLQALRDSIASDRPDAARTLAAIRAAEDAVEGVRAAIKAEELVEAHGP